MKELFFGVCCLLGTAAVAQNQMLNATRDQINTNGLVIPATGTLWGVASSDNGTVVGQTYLDTAWAKGELKLFQSVQPIGGKPVDTLSGLALRYNVYYNEIEILMNSFRDVRALQGKTIKSFSLEQAGKKSTFVSTQLYQADKPPVGFYEIVSPGKLALAVLNKTFLRKPTYNAAFEVGDKDAKITLMEDFYVLNGTKAKKFNPSKKTLLKLMEDQSEEVTQFLKINDLDLKDRTNLQRVFELYNGLL
jgi:hypothetical protein